MNEKNEKQAERGAFEAWIADQGVSVTLDDAWQAACEWQRAALAQQPQGEAAAWIHENDPARVISATQKAQAVRDGGASASSVRPYSVAAVLVTPQAAPVTQGLAVNDALRQWADDVGAAGFTRPNAAERAAFRDGFALAQSAPRADHAGEGAEMVASDKNLLGCNDVVGATRCRLAHETGLEQPAKSDDMVLVRRDVIGAACHAISQQKAAPKVLNCLRAAAMDVAAYAALDEDVANTAHRIAQLLLDDVRKVDCDIIESHIRALLAASPAAQGDDA